MRALLEHQYNKLFETYLFEKRQNAQAIISIIKHSLADFMRSCKKAAIYCNGGHTKMLMADFMFELKEVKYIVDNYNSSSDKSGFNLIKDDEMEENGIDGVIISSYKFKDSIVEGLKTKHPSIRYLNIYDVFEQRGINLQSDYYYNSHPFHYYRTINTFQREIENLNNTAQLEEKYFSLITEYIYIKDFRSAINYAVKLFDIVNKEKYKQLIEDLEKLYETECAAAGNIHENNVLLLCIDGLRRQDLDEEYMPKLSEILEHKGFAFERGYSFSTSTFESLIPAYSGNSDLRTCYYKQNVVAEADCSFVQEAKRQKRHMYFYTDMEHYIEGDIKYSESFQTITEKIWSFILDAVDQKNGLYYIHGGYESHFSFANPYTTDILISEGTAMLFDFLPQKGGKLRSNYERQHEDALRYLDDVVAPFMQVLGCRMLVYADHGNIILKEKCKLEEVRKSKLVYDEEWIRIPYIMCSPEMGRGKYSGLMSLMSINDMIISLLKREAYDIPQNSYIKIARSELYNPDFRHLYKKMDQERCLQAFEGFIFADGYKLIIYADGFMELLSTETDDVIDDERLKWKYYEVIREEVTVCESERIFTQAAGV